MQAGGETELSRERRYNRRGVDISGLTAVRRGIDVDGAPLGEAAGQNLVGQRVLQPLLGGPLQRGGPGNGVVFLGGEGGSLT